MLEIIQLIFNWEIKKKLYENTKKELAKKTWKYVQNYADAKSEVVQKILSDAIQENKTNQE